MLGGRLHVRGHGGVLRLLHPLRRATQDNGAVVEPSSVAIDFAVLQRGMDFGNNGEPPSRLTVDISGAYGAYAWPICAYTYVVVRKATLREGATCAHARETVAFWHWFYSSEFVAKMAADLGFGMLPPRLRTTIAEQLVQVCASGFQTLTQSPLPVTAAAPSRGPASAPSRSGAWHSAILNRTTDCCRAFVHRRNYPQSPNQAPTGSNPSQAAHPLPLAGQLPRSQPAFFFSVFLFFCSRDRRVSSPPSHASPPPKGASGQQLVGGGGGSWRPELRSRPRVHCHFFFVGPACLVQLCCDGQCLFHCSVSPPAKPGCPPPPRGRAEASHRFQTAKFGGPICPLAPPPPKHTDTSMFPRCRPIFFILQPQTPEAVGRRDWNGADTGQRNMQWTTALLLLLRWVGVGVVIATHEEAVSEAGVH